MQASLPKNKHPVHPLHQSFPTQPLGTHRQPTGSRNMDYLAGSSREAKMWPDCGSVRNRLGNPALWDQVANPGKQWAGNAWMLGGIWEGAPPTHPP